MNLKDEIKYWIPAVLWIILIFWMSTGMFSSENTYLFFEPIIRFFVPSITQKEIAFLHMILRKLAHVTEYFISGLLLFRAFKDGSDKKQEWLWAFSSLLAVVLIAVSDEFHQSFVAVRTASIVDVGIDIFGGFIAQCVSVWINYRHRQ